MVDRPKSRRPIIKIKSPINESSAFGITAEFSWVHAGQLYGGLFSLTGVPDQDKLIAEIHNIDPGVEVRNETALLTKIRERKPGSLSGRAVHIIQLARVRDSGAVNMHDINGVWRYAYASGYDRLADWLANMGKPIDKLDTQRYHAALEESAFVTFDQHGNAIERV